MVLQTLATPGSLVKKGDTIAEFDRQNMLNRLDDYRAAVVLAEEGFKKDKADVDVRLNAHAQSILVAKAEVEKARLDLKTTPVRGEIDAERLRLALEEAEARYKQLLAEVKFVQISTKADLRGEEIDLLQTKNELKRAEANADKMMVKAPIDGLTVMQQTFRGTEFGQIQQGDQLYPGQLYMQVVDTSSMIVDASLNQVDAELIRVGQKASIRFDAFPGLELPGRVLTIGAITKSIGFRGTYVKVIPVRLALEKMDPRVIPDLSVSADITVESEPQATAMVPVEAVQIDAPGADPYVFVRAGDAWVKREVEIGLRTYIHAAVRSGLKPGEVVALERPQPAGRTDTERASM